MPFVLTTGYPLRLLDEPALRGAPVVVKPYDARELALTLARITGQ